MTQRIHEIARSVQCERHWREEDIEKFALLIIYECAKIAYRYEEGDMIAQDILFEFNVDNCQDHK